MKLKRQPLSNKNIFVFISLLHVSERTWKTGKSIILPASRNEWKAAAICLLRFDQNRNLLLWVCVKQRRENINKPICLLWLPQTMTCSVHTSSSAHYTDCRPGKWKVSVWAKWFGHLCSNTVRWVDVHILEMSARCLWRVNIMIMASTRRQKAKILFLNWTKMRGLFLTRF